MPDLVRQHRAVHRRARLSVDHYTPATGGEPREVDILRGASFPLVGVALRHHQYRGVVSQAPHGVLHLTGVGLDTEVLLHAARRRTAAPGTSGRRAPAGTAHRARARRR